MPTLRLLVVLVLALPGVGVAQTPLKRLPGEPRLPRPEAECVEVLRAYAADSTKGRYTPPVVQVMVVPDYYKSDETVDVRFRIAVNRKVDSVEVRGTSSLELIAAIKRASRGYTFDAANVDGCPVEGWFSMQIQTVRRRE